MEDKEIIDLYWKREETAIEETAKKYGKYCYAIARNLSFHRYEYNHRKKRGAGEIDEQYIEEAHKGNIRRKATMKWKKAAVLAACLCMIVGVHFYSNQNHSTTTDTNKKKTVEEEKTSYVQKWTDDFEAKDYFTYAGENFDGEATSSEGSYVPNTKMKEISDQRRTLEKEGVLPEMAGYENESFVVEHSKNGSFYDITFAWYNDDEEDGKALQVVASKKNISTIQDSIQVAVDENGKVADSNVTVTKRDGVKIVASGIENGEKMITFHKDGGYYQITGSWSNDYESVVRLMEWFWEHPIDFSRFSSES